MNQTVACSALSPPAFEEGFDPIKDWLRSSIRSTTGRNSAASPTAFATDAGPGRPSCRALGAGTAARGNAHALHNGWQRQAVEHQPDTVLRSDRPFGNGDALSLSWRTGCARSRGT